MSVTCSGEVLTVIGPKPTLYQFHPTNVAKTQTLVPTPGDSTFVCLE